MEAALAELDRPEKVQKPSQRSQVESVEVEKNLELDRGAEPRELLDAAIERLQGEKAKVVEAAESQVESVPEENVEPLAMANAGDTTGHKLSADYQKWEDFEEDLDDLDDDCDMDRCWDSSGMDLNALTGPADEVKKIQAHWKREAVRMSKKCKRSMPQEAAPCAEVQSKSDVAGALVEVVPQPVLERPSVVASQGGRLDDNYSKWKKFDADAALLELDNEDTTEEGKAMRLSSGQGSAMLNCEGYTKDREEYDLDQDIERNMGGLKKIIAQNFKDASGLKGEGNELLKSGKAHEAIGKYREGLENLQLAQQASVLMSSSLAAKQSCLVADLWKNLAAAQLAISDFQGALASADEARLSITEALN